MRTGFLELGSDVPLLCELKLKRLNEFYYEELRRPVWRVCEFIARELQCTTEPERLKKIRGQNDFPANDDCFRVSYLTAVSYPVLL